MNYFVCTYGYFPEQEELVERSFREKVYLLHQYAQYPSAIDDVKPDDVLLLNVRGRGVVAFATSAGCVIHRDEKDEWNHVLATRDGWHEGKCGQRYSTYGITWATLQGGQFSLVKKVDATWAEKILTDMEWQKPYLPSANNNPDVPFRDMTPRLIAEELMDGRLEIPAVQRGFVWNATRLEVLWDSIMRDIPIGTFSIRAVKEKKGHWELLDGQQRGTSILTAYRPFPPKPILFEKNEDINTAQKKALLAPVIWMDLLPDPNKMYGRRYVFRVTTAAQPWGYHLTDDETGNSKISESCKREISLRYDWLNKNSNALLSEAVKPYPCELVPYGAKCPIPFSLILECCEERKRGNENAPNPSLEDFVRFCDERIRTCECVEGLHPWNWFSMKSDGLLQHFNLNRASIEEAWNAVVETVYGIDDYLILEVNAKSVSSDDVGVYFRRIGRGGVTPTQEEMNYSMLKAKLPPSLKRCMDLISESGWAAPSRMAVLALYTWQMRNPEVKGSAEALVNTICENPEYQKSFSSYTSIDCPEKGVPSFRNDLNALDELLGLKSNGLLPWHRMIFCTRANGDICRYLLRLIATNHAESKKINYAGLSAFIYYYSDAPSRVISKLTGANNVQDGIVSAYRDSYYGKPLLRRLVTPEEIDLLIDKINCEDWVGTWNRIKSDPVWQPIVQTITTGYTSEKAYSILLFGCRKFMDKVFPDYNALLPIWSEENCPWDYDHIFPKDQKENFDAVAKGCGDVIDSIGNLAPLPFSLNRARHDAFPTSAYPLCEVPNEKDNQQLMEYKMGLALLETVDQPYDYSKFSCGDVANPKEVFAQTLRRFSRLYRYWFEQLEISALLPLTTKRKELLGELQNEFPDVGYSIWIPGYNGQERRIADNPFKLSMTDWVSMPWISFGKCINGYFVGYGDDDQGLYATGICKLPAESSVDHDRRISIDGYETPENDAYWYAVKKYTERPSKEVVKNDLNGLIKYVQQL